MGTKECTLCGAQAEYLCVQRILEKYDAKYFRCPHCDLIQTESPYWLEEAPWSSIAHLDTGAVTRHASCVRVTIALAHIFGLDATSRCLDYGAGYGLFVRSMRDRGFGFRWWDKYAPNIFAQGFEARPDSAYDLVTCFELFEHLPSVREELAPILGCGHEVLLVGTVLHTGHKEGWWYYCPDLGGHVSFFSERTMRFIGEQWGYQVVASAEYTVFFRRTLSSRQHRLLKRILEASWMTRILDAFAPQYESLIGNDYADLLQEYFSRRQSKSSDGQSPLTEQLRTETLPASHWKRTKKTIALKLAETADVLIPPILERALTRVIATVKEGVATLDK